MALPPVVPALLESRQVNLPLPNKPSTGYTSLAPCRYLPSRGTHLNMRLHEQNDIYCSTCGLRYIGVRASASHFDPRLWVPEEKFERTSLFCCDLRPAPGTKSPRRTTSTGGSSFQNLKNGHFWSPLKKWGSKNTPKRV